MMISAVCYANKKFRELSERPLYFSITLIMAYQISIIGIRFLFNKHTVTSYVLPPSAFANKLIFMHQVYSMYFILAIDRFKTKSSKTFLLKFQRLFHVIIIKFWISSRRHAKFSMESGKRE